MQHKYTVLSSLLLACTLTACGGGGDGDATATPGPAGQVQGRWVTAAGSAPSYTAVGVPASNSSTALWLLANDASRLVKLTVQDSGALAGKAYALGQGTPATAVTGAWSAPAAKSLSLSGVVNGSLALAQTDALTAAAVQTDAAGAWKATAGGNAQSVTWTVADSGALTGSSTTGCTYQGNLTAMSNASAYTAAVKESCSDGTSTQYNGIATINPARNALSMVATSPDESVGVALFLSK